MFNLEKIFLVENNDKFGSIQDYALDDLQEQEIDSLRASIEAKVDSEESKAFHNLVAILSQRIADETYAARVGYPGFYDELEHESDEL